MNNKTKKRPITGLSKAIDGLRLFGSRIVRSFGFVDWVEFWGFVCVLAVVWAYYKVVSYMIAGGGAG